MEFRNKVLVIEDDSSVSFYIKSVLEGQGYDVIIAENGRDSETFASSHCPDVILLDLGLPDMDGVSVLKQIRSWSAVPIIVVSCRQREQDRFWHLTTVQTIMCRSRSALRSCLRV